MQRVALGSTGITTSRLAFGTGTNGWHGRSDQTALGQEGFAGLLRYAFERGITFWDMADAYGSHPHAALALKSLPREQLTLLTKTHSRSPEKVADDVERFRRELGTDLLDVVLLHGVTEPDWPERHAACRDALSQAREKGWVRAVGVSCHSLAAVQAAAEHPWVDLLMVRLNHAGVHMDAPPAEVVPVLQRAHAAGKALFAMKVIGQGKLAQDPAAAIQYVGGLGIVDAMTLGMVSRTQVDENLELVGRLEQPGI